MRVHEVVIKALDGKGGQSEGLMEVARESCAMLCPQI